MTSCPRCQGSMTKSRDHHGTYSACVQCGHYSYPKLPSSTSFPTPSPYSNPSITVPYTGTDPDLKTSKVRALVISASTGVIYRYRCPTCDMLTIQSKSYIGLNAKRYSCENKHSITVSRNPSNTPIGWKLSND